MRSASLIKLIILVSCPGIKASFSESGFVCCGESGVGNGVFGENVFE